MGGLARSRPRRDVSVTLIVPAALRDLSGGRARLELGPAEVETVADAFGRLRESAPGVYHRIVTEAGRSART